ncbi:MAG: universal stress protein [Burkholderiaceae bacterium]
MLKVLVPTDGSANSLRAVRHVVAEYRRDPALEVHLLNVQPRLSRHIARFVARRDRHAWHGARAQAAMVEATAALDEAGVPHQAHWALGERASEICRTATRIGAHHIVIGATRSHSVARLLQEPVIDHLLKITTVPVKLVAGEGVSRWQRWGLPVGILGVGGLMLLALE